MDDLHGKIALVTGSSQGLGRELALALGRAGCTVVVNCRGHIDKARSVAEEIRNAGGNAVVKACDVSEEAAVRQMFAELRSEFGGTDIVVNNARLDPWRRTADMSEGEWFERVLAVNLKSAHLCSFYLLEELKERKSGFGRIVNISSVRAFRPAEPGMVAYAASKAGMHAVTRAFAENGAKYGLTANTVAPGMIVTENLKARVTPEKLAEEASCIPLGRGGSCEEIADAVLFVLRNGYVTGETVNINGGMYYAP